MHFGDSFTCGTRRAALKQPSHHSIKLRNCSAKFLINKQGESRTEDLRVLIVPPLGVTFRVFAETSVVVVVDAWVIRRKHR